MIFFRRLLGWLAACQKYNQEKKIRRMPWNIFYRVEVNYWTNHFMMITFKLKSHCFIKLVNMIFRNCIMEQHVDCHSMNSTQINLTLMWGPNPAADNIRKEPVKTEKHWVHKEQLKQMTWSLVCVCVCVLNYLIPGVGVAFWTLANAPVCHYTYLLYVTPAFLTIHHQIVELLSW